MKHLQRAARIGSASVLFFASAACSSAGGLGGILGGVLGGGAGSNQVRGSIRDVDTRSRQISIEQSNGQTVRVTYDNNTQVVYQNQNYPVTALEFGDRVTARISSGGGNSGYTDLIQVDQSVSSGGGTGSGNVQTFEGTARNIDRANGVFTLSSNNYGNVLVSMPYNPRQSDVSRFQNLRSGDYVRLYGVMLNNSRIELRQFN